MRFATSHIVPLQDVIQQGEFSDCVLESQQDQSSWDITENVLLRRCSPTQSIITPLWRPFHFIDLFAGIGGMRIAFENVGGNCVFSSEWDKSACETYRANFGDTPHGDITKIPTSDIPSHDILLAGFPCQPFSIIGKRRGFGDTRGTLFFEIERILRDKKPIACLLENVKQFRTHDQGRTCATVLETLNLLGYTTSVAVLNAIDYGVAQTRQRTFIVGFRQPLEFRFPKPYSWRPDLADILERDEDVEPQLWASDYIKKRRLERIHSQGRTPFYPSIWHENKGGHIGIHPFSCALRHNASYNYLLVNGNRRPTAREMLRLQGFPESYRVVANHTEMRAQLGNSVTVPTVTAAEMMLALRKNIVVAAKSHFAL
ncbi:MAG: DNA (cytosine-5-)-methyltransferase [Thermoguttaceae bacterium]